MTFMERYCSVVGWNRVLSMVKSSDYHKHDIQRTHNVQKHTDNVHTTYTKRTDNVQTTYRQRTNNVDPTK